MILVFDMSFKALFGYRGATGSIEPGLSKLLHTPMSHVDIIMQHWLS